jgi:hypothetical protein
MSLQAAVEKKHQSRRKTSNTFILSVQEAWIHLTASTISKVANSKPQVLELIVTEGEETIFRWRSNKA